MLRTVGEWVGRLRKLTSDMRAQTGIDAILREEGIDGVNELRSLLRGEIQAARSRDRYEYYGDEPSPPDPLSEYPIEGADVAGAIADDLLAVTTTSAAGTQPALEAAS
jgi:sec-independent protein translocase protein TatB